MGTAMALAMPIALSDRRHAIDRASGERKLDEHIVGLWETFATRGSAACPVCEAGTLRPVFVAQAGSLSGRCDSCGSELD
jgi:hypothetical protein